MSWKFCVIVDHFTRQSSLDDNIEEASGGPGGSAANSQRSIEVLYAGAGGKPSKPDAVKVSWRTGLVLTDLIKRYSPLPVRPWPGLAHFTEI